MKKPSSEERIHARLRELTQEARKLRSDLKLSRQRPFRTDPLNIRSHAAPGPPIKPRPKD